MVRRECEIEIVFRMGHQAKAQEGIDILAVHREQQSFKNCLSMQECGEIRSSDISSAIDKFLAGQWADKAREFVLCVAIPLKTRNNKMNWIVNGADLLKKISGSLCGMGHRLGTLSERLKNSPDLVDDFFGREWVKIFNGPDSRRQI